MIYLKYFRSCAIGLNTSRDRTENIPQFLKLRVLKRVAQTM